MSGVRKRTWASGTVTWEASWYDSSGQRHTANYDTRSEAEAARAEQLRARQRGGSGDPTAGGLTLADWHATWAATRTVRPSTLAREDAIWRCHIEPVLGRRRLADLRRSALSAWVAGLSGDGLAPATVVRCSGVLHRILAAAVEDGVLMANPADGMARPRVDPSERRFLSPAELDRIEAAIDAQWALVVPFAATVGLRIGELSALRVRDLDLDAGTVRVRGTAVELSGHRSVTTPKSRAGLRVVPTVTPALAARLAEHIDARGAGKGDWLFTTPEGTPIRLTNWRNRTWRPAVAAAGLDDPQPTPHALRHTAIAGWLAAGVPVVRAAAWAGHSPAVLERTYAHLLDADHEPVRAKLDELFGRT